jgi:hypothetical protein
MVIRGTTYARVGTRDGSRVYYGVFECARVSNSARLGRSAHICGNDDCCAGRYNACHYTGCGDKPGRNRETRQR